MGKQNDMIMRGRAVAALAAVAVALGALGALLPGGGGDAEVAPALQSSR